MAYNHIFRQSSGVSFVLTLVLVMVVLNVIIAAASQAPIS